VQCLTDAGVEADDAAGLVGRRPLTERWPDGMPRPAIYRPLATMLEGKPG
jgi:hypothetical protein